MLNTVFVYYNLGVWLHLTFLDFVAEHVDLSLAGAWPFNNVQTVDLQLRCRGRLCKHTHTHTEHLLDGSGRKYIYIAVVLRYWFVSRLKTIVKAVMHSCQCQEDVWEAGG